MILNLRRDPNGGLGLTCTVPSYTQAGKDYTVIRSNEGEWRCTCPQSFIKKVECKHIDEAMTEVYRQDLTAKPQLFIVRFRRLATVKMQEAVVLASTPLEARRTFLTTYTMYRTHIIDVTATDRKILIR